MGDYRKLANQPLAFALAEFRFSPVLQISDHIPALQEALRKTYPTLETLKEQSIQIQSGNINVASQDRWGLVSADRQHAVTVDHKRLIYFTTDYPRFEGFADSCLDALKHLERLASPDLIMRVGLRYGDVIRITEAESLEDFVDRYFDFPKCIHNLGEPEHQKDEILIRTSVGRLLIRSIYGKHHLVCMPDLGGSPIVPKPDSEPSLRIILDFDHFWAGGSTATRFELPQIRALLEQLHSTSREAFWQVTTDKARNEKWS
jgi:uncharacterized protein (TIGR04255 family)